MPARARLSGPTLGTARLELRPFERSDVPELHALFVVDEVRHYLLDGEVVSRAWVEEEVSTSEERFGESDSCGLWAFRRHDASGIIGFVGFRPFFEPPELQLVYGLEPAHWGLGFATEASSAVLAHAFATLGFSDVRAATDVPNVASIEVLRRLGFNEWRRTEEGEHGTVFFRVDAHEWKA